MFAEAWQLLAKRDCNALRLQAGGAPVMTKAASGSRSSSAASATLTCGKLSSSGLGEEAGRRWVRNPRSGTSGMPGVDFHQTPRLRSEEHTSELQSRLQPVCPPLRV